MLVGRMEVNKDVNRGYDDLGEDENDDDPFEELALA